MDSRIFKERSSVNDTRDRFLAAIKPLDRTENITICEGVGRVLATGILAPRNVPHYRRSAMDGYAVRSADIMGASPTNPVILQIGDGIDEGTCCPVGTGAYVPDDADAVLMTEDTICIGDMIEVRAQVHPGKNIGDIGEDVRKNEIIFNRGHLLRPCDVAVLASLGIREVKVYSRAVVAVIPTGNDLIPLDSSSEVPPPGKTLDINSLMIGLYVRQWGAQPRCCPIVPEDRELIKKAISENMDADFIVISGGTSVGEKDYVPDVLASMGEKLVHGVGLSPGKPTALGVIGEIPVLCMPGYPAAGLVALFAFGKPAIRKKGNIPQIPDITVKARLTGKINSREGYVSYARVILEGNTARPLMTAGAGILSSIAKSNGFVIIPENVEGYEEGNEVDVVLIE
ncbi:gephyrin-like molybdotransferase Glp [Methanolobus chelungpuianus]|uniref:Molybdenum cofactor biosynthesis protein MoaA n=1 Tax=Methanolobus chelungpuianus TaxID=502115 RepID=A0AAE3H9U1_9EURY|nr:gephyrin-like molybdotransferase Glp [Methanolobus chelungpuianus]MCQ6962610.1 molybdenum cofactor biosynthesis protein MoaA [Methanolobus chelungpuianus]